MEISVPQFKFEEFNNKSCCQYLIEGVVPNTIFYAGDEYVATGSMGRGDLSNRFIFAYRVVSIDKYNGILKPLEYNRHWLAVDLYPPYGPRL